MTSSVHNWASRLFFWLALAAVLVPALGSTGSPLRPGQGSAFSAFTSNVSLGPSRPAPVEKQRRELRSPGGSGAVAAPVILALAEPPASPPAAPLQSRGNDPPSEGFISGPVGARAPPSSRTF